MSNEKGKDKDLEFEKRESWEISYTNSDGENRQIHCNNGNVHVHTGGENVRKGNDSWDTKQDTNLTETDKQVIQETRNRNGKDWWKNDN